MSYLGRITNTSPGGIAVARAPFFLPTGVSLHELIDYQNSKYYFTDVAEN